MKKLLLIIILILGAVLFLLGWDKYTSPEYSLGEVISAIKNHDVTQFNKYVDIDGVVESAINQLLRGRDKNSVVLNQREETGPNIDKGLLDIMRPQLVNDLKRQLIDQVETGSFESDDTSSCFSETPLLYGVDVKDVLNCIKFVKQEGSIAYVGVDVSLGSADDVFVVNLKMRDRGVYWQLVEIVNIDKVLIKKRSIDNARAVELDEKEFLKIKESKDVNVLKGYLNAHAGGLYVTKVREMIEEVLYEKLSDSSSIEDMKKYLNECPRCVHEQEVRAALGRKIEINITEPMGIKMVSIPAGDFMTLDRSNFVPFTKVSGFKMSTTEITIQQFRVFAKDVNYPHGEWNDQYPYISNEQPVVFVSYQDATAYCDWLSQRTGLYFRLPFAYEWEYACRAGSDTKYFSGDEELNLSETDWYKGNSSGKTHMVASRKANKWGLYDMHGNVREWCSADIHGVAPIAAGGSWMSEANYCVSFRRDKYDNNTKFGSIGFRVVREY
ncbi:SUMF1/EgtB/PvdO family nonheme iron enzyme [bacterium]|nr:SUMF1/EgtB/PvdO family nonheme iron enzyme [bacterium]